MSKKKPQGPRDVNISAWHKPIMAAALVVVAACAIFSTTLQQPYLWDDDTQIQKKSYFTDPAALKKLWSRDYYEMTAEESYRPLDTLSLLAVHSVFGESPKSQRVVSILLNALNTLLVFLLLRRWWPLLAACAGALLFALHPIHTEVVNCVSYRDELLAGFFVLSGMLLYVHKRRALTLIAYGLALLSKENAIVFPVLIFGLEVLCGQSTISFRENARAFVRSRFAMGALAVTAAYLFLRFVLLPNAHLKAGYPGGSLVTNFTTMGPVLVDYFALLLWPVPLAISYDVPILLSPFNIRFLVFIVAMAGLAVMFQFLVRRDRPAAFFLLWIVVPLLPVLNFIPFLNVSLMYERYLYLPSVGVAALAAFLVSKLPKKVEIVVPVLLLAFCALGTEARNRDWSSGEKLYAENIRVFPRNHSVYVFLGEEYLKQGRVDRAREQFEKSLALKPDYSPALNALGVAENKTGEFNSAITHFQAAIEAAPDFDNAKKNLSATLFQMGRSTEAFALVQTELEKNPRLAWAHENRAIFYNLMSQPKEERAALEQALGLGLYWPGAHSQLGALLFHSGLLREAIGEFQQELQRNPSDAETHANLGIAYMQTRQVHEAAAAFRAALVLDPNNESSKKGLSLLGPT